MGSASASPAARANVALVIVDQNDVRTIRRR